MTKTINKNAAEMKAVKKKVKYATAQQIIDDETNVSYPAFNASQTAYYKAATALEDATKAAKGKKKNSKDKTAKALIKAKYAAIDDFNASVKKMNDARAAMFKTTKKKKMSFQELEFLKDVGDVTDSAQAAQPFVKKPYSEMSNQEKANYINKYGSKNAGKEVVYNANTKLTEEVLEDVQAPTFSGKLQIKPKVVKVGKRVMRASVPKKIVDDFNLNSKFKKPKGWAKLSEKAKSIIEHASLQTKNINRHSKKVLELAREGKLAPVFKWAVSPWETQNWFYDAHADRISVAGTPSNPGRFLNDYKNKRFTPYLYKPVYSDSTGNAYTTYGTGYKQATYNLATGSAYPSTPSLLYDTIIKYVNRTFGSWEMKKDGKAVRNMGKKGNTSTVTLAWGDEQSGQTVVRQVSLKSKQDFIDQFERISLGQYGNTVSGSDTIPEGSQWVPTYFTIGSYGGKVKGNGAVGGPAFDPHPTFKILNIANTECALACVRRFATQQEGADKRMPRIATLVKTIPDYKEGGMTPDELDCLEKHFNIGVNVYDAAADEMFLRETDKKDVPICELLFTMQHGEGHYLLIVDRKKPKVPKEKKKKDKKGPKIIKKFLVWDCETVWDRYSNNVLKPWSNAWRVFNGNERSSFSPKRMLNENDDDYKIRQKEFATQMIRQGDTHYCDWRTEANPIKAMLEWIAANSRYEYEEWGKTIYCKINYTLVTFNGSGFDNFFLMDEATKMGMVNSIFMASGRILNYKLAGGHDSWDLNKFIACSLDTACDNFKSCPIKQKGFDHSLPQKAYDANSKKGVCDWLSSLDGEPIIEHISGVTRAFVPNLSVEYNKCDVLATLDVMQKYRNACYKTLGCDPTEYMTIGSMTFKTWQDQSEHETVAPDNESDDKQIRRSMVAGRTQCYYGKQHYKLVTRFVDYCSMYPHVMTAEQNRFPVGKYTKTDRYVEGKMGIYYCNIKHQRAKWQNAEEIKKSFATIDKETLDRIPECDRKYAPAIVPRRAKLSNGEPDKTKALDWAYRGKQTGVYLTSVDYEMIKKHAGEDAVEVMPGWRDEEGVKTDDVGIFWEEDTNELFKDFLGGLAKEKNRQDDLKKEKSPEYNDAIREACKLTSNSLSGKVAQRSFEDTSKFLKTSKDVEAWFGPENNKKVQDITLNYVTPNVCMGSGKRTDTWGESEKEQANHSPSYHACFIYSYGRKLLYDGILSRYVCMYSDTDSGCITDYDFKRLEKEQTAILPHVTGNKKVYGDLELESSGTDLITVHPKCYANWNESERLSGLDKDKEKRTCEPKLKCKGLKGRDRYALISDYPELQKEYSKEDVYVYNKDGTIRVDGYGEPVLKSGCSGAALKKCKANMAGPDENGVTPTLSDFVEKQCVNEDLPLVCDAAMFKAMLAADGEKSICVFSSQLVKGVDVVLDDEGKKLELGEDDKEAHASYVEKGNVVKSLSSAFQVRQRFLLKVL